MKLNLDFLVACVVDRVQSSYHPSQIALVNITEEIEQQNKDVGRFVLLCDNNVIENRDQESYHLMDDECIQAYSVKTGNVFGGVTGLR